MGSAPPEAASDPWLAQLEALYARVDAMYAGWGCEDSTECCRFGLTGRQPYVTAIEVLGVRHGLADVPMAEDSPGGRAKGRATGELARRTLPVVAAPSEERACPLLNQEQRCSIYAVRPVGCRSHYCHRASAGTGPSREQLDSLMQEIAALAARYRLGGETAQPLLTVLAALGFD